MGIVIDLILVAILISSIALGYKKGLVGVIFNICAFFVAIVATIVLYKPVSNFIINNTEIDDKIRNTIMEKYGATETEDSTSKASGIASFIENTIQKAENQTRQEAVESLANEISIKAVQVAVALSLFIVIRILLIFLRFITESIAELPILRQFNGAGGAIYGALRGILIIYILVNILYLVVSINQNGKIQEAIDNSHVTKYLYEHNLIINSIDF